MKKTLLMKHKNNKSKPETHLVSQKGGILVTFCVLIIGLCIFGALALDYRMAITKRHSIDQLADMMVLAAIDGFHTDEVFINTVNRLPPQDEVIARVVSGMRNAQNVFLAAQNSVIKTSELVDPFGTSVNWRTEYQELLNWVQSEGPVYTFPTSAYNASAVKFLGGDFRAISPITNADNPMDIKAVTVNLEMKPGARIQPFFSSVFRREPLRASSASTAEVVNASITRSVVLAVDRSLSMAAFTGPGPLAPSGSEYMYFKHWLQLGDHPIRPIQSVLDAAQILPDTLADLNRYRDSSLNNSFGVVTFDIVAEALEFEAASGDKDKHLSHDEDGTEYQEVKDALAAPLTSQKVPRLVPRGDFDETDPACNQYHVLGSDSCRHDALRTTQDFKSHWYSKLTTTGPTPNDLHALRPLEDGKAPSSFLPWTNTDGSVGLETAIEILRQERRRFVTLENHAPESFQAEIVFLSDTVMNTFHDRNILQDGVDSYPVIPTTGSGDIRCDQREFYNADTPAYDRIVIPASWRGRISQPKFYRDLYHSGALRWTKDNFDPDRPPAGFEPKGIETIINGSLANMVSFAKPCATSNGAEAGCCPGPDCMGIVSKTARYRTNSTKIQANTYFTCGDVALMDYARWAEANKIRIHALGFELSMQSTEAQRTGRFLLDYLSDPNNDAVDVGLLFEDVQCDHTTGSCLELEEAFKNIGKLLDVRLTSNRAD